MVISGSLLPGQSAVTVGNCASSLSAFFPFYQVDRGPVFTGPPLLSLTGNTAPTPPHAALPSVKSNSPRFFDLAFNVAFSVGSLENNL